MECKFCAGAPAWLIKKYKFWTVYLQKNQSYLGRTVIVLNRHEADFLFTTDEERIEFYHISYKMREVIKSAFGAAAFDYMLPNTKEQHAHMLIIPRYAQRTTFAGTVFEDLQYGKHFDPYREVTLQNEVYTKIINTIREIAGPSTKEKQKKLKS
jgi:diadenosine tetraphosphate (Ap4A) HIT family hydrolase